MAKRFETATVAAVTAAVVGGLDLAVGLPLQNAAIDLDTVFGRVERDAAQLAKVAQAVAAGAARGEACTPGFGNLVADVHHLTGRAGAQLEAFWVLARVVLGAAGARALKDAVAG